MKKILVILASALLVSFLPNAVVGQIPAVRGALRAASIASRIKPVKPPRIAVPHVSGVPGVGCGSRIAGTVPSPSPVPNVGIPAGVFKALAFPDTAALRNSLRQYPESPRLSLTEYADSMAYYSDAAVAELLDAYIDNSHLLQYFCTDCYSGPNMEYMTGCLDLCRSPCLSRFVENDSTRAYRLAELAAIIASENNFYHYRDILRSISPDTYEKMRLQLLDNIAGNFGSICDKGPDADRARFRMVAGTSADPANDLGDMMTMPYARILSNIWGYSHKPFMKYIKECRQCTRRMEAMIANIDDFAKYVTAAENAEEDQLWRERTAHYLRYILDPSQTGHIDSVENILSQIKKSGIESKYDMILETAVILADMKGFTDANPALALETLKPYSKLADSDKAAPLYRKYYYEYLSLLYDAVGDEKNAGKVAKKLDKINKAFQAPD